MFKKIFLALATTFILGVVSPQSISAETDSNVPNSVEPTIIRWIYVDGVTFREPTFPPPSRSYSRTVNGASYSGTIYRDFYSTSPGDDMYFSSYSGTLYRD